MGMIDRQTIDKILDATEIVDVVSDFVSLKKHGSSYLGLCPFHNDRTPSFSVSPSRGIFKCFSCGKAGNAVSFLMDLESMSYAEAIRWLGKKYGIEIKEREQSSAEREAEEQRQAMFAANEFALKHFESTLKDTPDGRNIGLAYFRERGINDAMIAKFHLGYALERSDDFYSKARTAGYDTDVLVETGLCIRTDSGRIYDRFKGRVIYPVHSLSGRVVAFGGRTLSREKTVAKYVNSPESKIYSKSHELYGIYQARNAIARKKFAILVEGYMDVISMHQAGVENVVASSGTSLTDGQIRMIKRFANEVVLIYDSDAAGIKASLRGINMLVAAGFSLKVVLLPDGDDPDSFAQHHSSSEVEQYIEQHKTDLIGFKVDILMRDAANDPRRRAEAINDILHTIALIPNVVEQSIYLDECAAKVGVASATLGLQLKRIIVEQREADYRQQQRRQAQESLGNIDDARADEEAARAEQADKHVSVTTAPPQVPKQIFIAERDLIRYTLRYGMMYLCDVYTDDQSDSTVAMSVIDYIECELNNDNVQFSYAPFAEIWRQAIEVRNSLWVNAFQAHQPEIEARCNAELSAGIDRIRQEATNVGEIQRREEQLHAEIDCLRTTLTDEFAASFIRDRLMRNEDRTITDLVAQLTANRVVLSKMYPRGDIHEELQTQVPLAVNTLKGALLKQQILELTTRLSTITADCRDEIENILLKIKELKEISMKFDKFNGEIVITPASRK